MKHLLLLVLCGGLIPATAQQTNFERLVSNMQGSFSSAAQAKSDTNYFDIELEMVRIWPAHEDGVWLYIEQAVASNKGKPYRQRIYHVQEVNDSTFTSTMYKINGGKAWYGGYKTPKLFGDLSMDSISLIPGCAITLHPNGAHFVGSTNERDCGNAWGKATYATSEVEMFEDRLVSWDRGWNDAGEHVWGAEHGGYVFEKITNKSTNEQEAVQEFLTDYTGYSVDLENPTQSCFERKADQTGRIMLLLELDKKGKVLKSSFLPKASDSTSKYLLNLAKQDVQKLEFKAFAERTTKVLYCFTAE